MGYYFAWIRRCVEEAKIPEMIKARRLLCQERHETISQLFHETDEIIETQIIKRLYENMADILFERRTGISIIIHRDDHTNLLSALYQDGLLMANAYQQLPRILDGLAHANPHLRILEVGVGTGSATRVAMKALTGPNSIKRYREYVFTDVSPGFLAAAKASLADFRDIRYSALDIEADPAAQGYRPVYDIVLASGVLHATASISQTLRNCQKFLRPRGKLVLVEPTAVDNVIASFILGPLTGYWLGIPDGRVNSPFVTSETWDRVLREVGFSDVELELDDYSRPNNFTTTLVSTLIESGTALQDHKKIGSALGGVEVQLLHHPEHDQPLLGKLQGELERRGILAQVVPLDQATSVVSRDAHVVVLLDDEKDFLLDIEGRCLAMLQYLVHKKATLLCLTFCGFLRGLNPEGALILGLLRTIGTENPTGRFISIDVSIENSDPAMYDSDELTRGIVDQLFPSPDELKDAEDGSHSLRANDREYIWQDGYLWISRTVPDETFESYAEIPLSDNQEQPASALLLYPDDSRGPVRAAFSTPDIFDSLYFRPYTEILAPISSNYIDVKFAAVGINQEDLAVSYNHWDVDNLSSEYTGVVTAVDIDAASLFSIGDLVYGIGRGHFGNYNRVPAAFAQKLTAQDNLVEVATMPRAYMTAIYAFEHVSRLRRGHKVLIQSATSGLGLAAIQLARTKGAEVFAMAGTPEKADFLVREMKLLGSHVITISVGDGTFSLDQKLVHMTPDSRGFDIILSTARGDMLHTCVQALAPLGHLVDVGCADMQESKALEMGLFGKGASFSSVDLSLVLDADPALGKELMQTVHRYYRDGLIGPIRPFSVTDVSKLGQVLSKFSEDTHVGKLVVTFQDPQALVKMPPAASRPRVQFDPAACYIVVGGLDSLDRSIVRWMCERGTRKLVVLSRRGIEELGLAAQGLMDTLTKRGIDIQFLTCDISDQSQVMRLFQNISSASSITPLKGIVHTAVSYPNVLFDKLTVSQWRDRVVAKVRGIKNLHEATLSLHPTRLDFFVMITSIQSIYASATQSACTAASAFQEAFARYRQRLGMPATSISLGPVRDIGEPGQDSVTVNMFAQDRILTLSEAEFLVRLESAFLNAHDNNISNNNSGGDNWIGQAEDPLSASNILTCLDPGAIAVKEHDKEVDADDAGPYNPSKSVEPRWYSDARMSLIMRALEDARRDLRTRSPPGVAAVAQEGDDNTGKSSVERIRRQFDAATAAGTPERSKTVDFVAGAITMAVAEMLFVDVSNVNPALTVADHGVDSLIAALLLNWLSDALGTKINMRELLDAKTSIATLAGWIVDTALAKKQNLREEQ